MANDPCTLTTVKFRASYPNLFKPRKNDLNGKEEFSVTALFEPGADMTPIRNAMAAAVKKKFGDKPPSNLRMPLRDQADREKDGKMPEGMAKGAFYLNLKSTNKPSVVDQSVQPLIEPSKIYGGCWLRANITAFAYDAKANKGVSFSLNHVQLVGDGEPLSGRPMVSDAFEPIADAQSAEDIFK